MECLKAWLSCTSCLSQLACQSIQTANHNYIWSWLGDYFGNWAGEHWTSCTEEIILFVTGEEHRNNLGHRRRTGVLEIRRKKKKSGSQKAFKEIPVTNLQPTFSANILSSCFPFPSSCSPPVFYCLFQMSWSSCWPATVLEHAKWTPSPSFLAENLWQKNIYSFLGKSCITSCCCLSHHCRILMSH